MITIQDRLSTVILPLRMDNGEIMGTEKIGQGMMVIACILGMGLLTMFFSDAEKRQYNPNASVQSDVNAKSIAVKLQRNRQGHYVMTGKINNVDAEFLLDTGATDVVIPEALAKQFNLIRGRPQQARTANGIVTVYDTSIAELSIGAITLYNVSASINPAMAPPAILLGMSALEQVEFIQRGDSLTLRQIF